MRIEIPTITPDAYATIAREVFAKRNKGYKNKTTKWIDKEICESLIGTSFEVCSELWNLINPLVTISPDAKPKHLLWALLFLKNYCIEKINARLVGGVDAKTFRKWSWLFVEGVAKLKDSVVSLCRSRF
jgi:hypothetical protein